MVQALCMKYLSSWLHERNFFKDHGDRQAGLGSTGAIMLMKSPCLSHSHTHLILAVLYTHVLDTPPPFFLVTVTTADHCFYNTSEFYHG